GVPERGRHSREAGTTRGRGGARRRAKRPDRHDHQGLVRRLSGRRGLSLSAAALHESRGRRQRVVLRESGVRFAGDGVPSRAGRDQAQCVVSPGGLGGVRRCANGVLVLLQRAVRRAAVDQTVRAAGDLQRPTLDGRHHRAARGQMTRFIVRRLLLSIPTLFGVLVVAFLLLYVAPGDPVESMVGERADSATIARLRAQLHLDDPLPARFGNYVGTVLPGDLGNSYITNRPITQDIRERFPKTLQLAGAAMLLATIIGMTLGVLSARKPGG